MAVNQSGIKYAIDLNSAGKSAIEKKSIQTNSIEEQPAGKNINVEKLNVVNFPEFLGVLLPVSLAITLGMVISLRRLHKSEQTDVKDVFSHFEPFSCRNCRFFSLNPYIKCAVHPSTVLTKQAIDCPDYYPHNDNCH